MFQSGAGLEVLENKGFMTTRVYLPWQFIVNTIFLLILMILNFSVLCTDMFFVEHEIYRYFS